MSDSNDLKDTVKTRKEKFFVEIKDKLQLTKKFFMNATSNFNQICNWIDDSVLVNIRKSHLSLIGVFVILLIWVL